MSAPEGRLMRRAEALWPDARLLAERRCREALYRLRRGEGGFYDHDDLLQDLFLEFCALLRRPEFARLPDEALTWAHAPLRTAWSRALWGGGLRILRRAPQRLWRRFEQPCPPEWLDGAAYDAQRNNAGRGEPRPAPGALVGEDGARVADSLAQLAALEAALRRLRPAQRQALYMTALQELPSETVARRLGLPSGAAVRQRVRSARKALRPAREALRPARPTLRPARPTLRPARPTLRPARPTLRPARHTPCEPPQEEHDG